MTITSPTNPTVKALVRLRKRRERDSTARYLIEGTRELTRALDGAVKLEAVYLCPEFHRKEAAELVRTLQQTSVRVVELGPEAFAKASMRQGPDGVLAVAVREPIHLDAVTLSTRPLVLVADGIEKPGNLGTMIRSAATAGADAVLVTEAATDIYNPGVIRASQGAMFALPVVQTSARDAHQWLAGEGLAVHPADPDAEVLVWNADLNSAVALVVGSEHTGLSEVWAAQRTSAIRIPMVRGGDSLNASAAAAVLLFEATRQRASRLTEHPQAIIDEHIVE